MIIFPGSLMGILSHEVVEKIWYEACKSNQSINSIHHVARDYKEDRTIDNRPSKTMIRTLPIVSYGAIDNQSYVSS